MEKKNQAKPQSWRIHLLALGILFSVIALVGIGLGLFLIDRPCSPGAYACVKLEVEGEPVVGAEFDVIVEAQSRLKSPEGF
jgi:hypothetical protein